MGIKVKFSNLWNNKNMETFVKRLRELRIENNIGQVELAKRIGVGKSIISLWELDECEPTLSKLIALSKFFDVSIDYLAGIDIN